MKTSKMTLGRRGEDVACEYLVSMGHVILERNCRRGHLEMDIISLDGDGVHFVEVKSRTAPVSASPQENVNAAKQRKIAAGALRYLNSTKDERLARDLEVIFDVIAVVFDGGKTIVEYFPHAFTPMYV